MLKDAIIKNRRSSRARIKDINYLYHSIESDCSKSNPVFFSGSCKT